MSYSRWGHSYWYTFWRVSYADVETRDNAVFEVCGSAAFTSKELRDNLQECLGKTKDITKCSDTDIIELTSYIDRFLNDVDEEFPECHH